MSRDELVVVVARQAGQLAERAEEITAQDRQIAVMAGQLAELMEANEALAAKLARLEHLLSRNSGNSSSPPSRDDDPGKPAPPQKKRRERNPARARGKQPGGPGSHLAWTDDPDERRDRFPSAATAEPTWPRRVIWAWSTPASTPHPDLAAFAVPCLRPARSPGRRGA